MLRRTLIIACSLFFGMHAMTPAEAVESGSRGALLYATHCNACHTARIHWRELKLVTDMESLHTQVRRWQDNIGQEWTDAEIADVVHYLNALYYDFPDAGRIDAPKDEKSVPSPQNY